MSQAKTHLTARVSPELVAFYSNAARERAVPRGELVTEALELYRVILKERLQVLNDRRNRMRDGGHIVEGYIDMEAYEDDNQG